MVTFRNNNNRRNNFRRNTRGFKSNGDRNKFSPSFSNNENFQRKTQVEIIIMHQNLLKNIIIFLKLYQAGIKFYLKIIFNTLIILLEFKMKTKIIKEISIHKMTINPKLLLK